MLPKPVIRILRASVVRFSFIGERKYAVSPNSRWATDCLTFYKWHIMIFLGKFPWWKNPKLLQTSYVDGPLWLNLNWHISKSSSKFGPSSSITIALNLVPPALHVPISSTFGNPACNIPKSQSEVVDLWLNSKHFIQIGDNDLSTYLWWNKFRYI